MRNYRVDNERMMRVQEELLQTMNMLQRQVNRNSGTKQSANARQAEASRYHDRRDDNRKSRQSRSVSRHHYHSLEHSTKRSHARLRSESSPSVSLVRRQRTRLESDIL
jgi:hypothetical protein